MFDLVALSHHRCPFCRAEHALTNLRCCVRLPPSVATSTQALPPKLARLRCLLKDELEAASKSCVAVVVVESEELKSVIEQDQPLQSCANRQQKIVACTHATFGGKSSMAEKAELVVVATPSLHPRSVANKRLQAPNARILHLLTPLEERVLARIGNDTTRVYTGHNRSTNPTPPVGFDCVDVAFSNPLHAPVFARPNILASL